jgi:hypothetical protein
VTTSGIGSVRFLADGVVVGEVVSSPDSMLWDSTSVEAGSHQISPLRLTRPATPILRLAMHSSMARQYATQ